MSSAKWRGIAFAIGVLSAPFAVAACGGDSHGPGASGDGPADATSAPGDGATSVTITANDAGLSSTMTGPVDSCPSVPGCPAGFQCGRYEDPCTGQVFACGSPCNSGDICATDPGDPTAQTCQPKSCTGKCGVVAVDSCGVAVSCGGCDAGQDCVDNACVAAGPSDAGQGDGGCAAPTCTPDPQTNLCGTVTNGCGQTKSCTCPSGQSCLGGVCGSTPPECTDTEGGSFCGSMPNACGSGSVACGSCSGSTECVGHMCTECTPPTCGSAKCGSVNNGCGPSVSCGDCAGTEVCYEATCCTPSSCAEAEDAGLVTGCAAVDLGCGVEKSCESCPEGSVCTNNVCVACTPKTCADFGDAGCGHSDGCGDTLDCCPNGTTCLGGSICCAAGEVDYNGSCCSPACDPSQPPGTQISCGQVIYCTSGTGGGGSGGPR